MSKQAGTDERGPLIDADLALGHEFPAFTSTHDERDLALYALGVGAADDPTDERELRRVYELHADGFEPLPSYAVVPAVNGYLAMLRAGEQAPGLRYGLDRLLHGEQSTELMRPLPPRATLTHRARVKDLVDKGEHALVVVEARSHDEAGDLLAINELTTFIRGAGGFGGARRPSRPTSAPPDRPPDEVVRQRTHPGQALLYRLSGDWNPLHVDPRFAAAAGFARPILHGLCTFGYATRHVLDRVAGGDVRRFRSIKVRFADTVVPGETLVTEMWRESATDVAFQVKVAERDKVVISGAALTLHPTST